MMTAQIRQSAHASAPDAFDETSRLVEITPEEREIGIRTKRYFDRTLKRRPPWVIKAGEISILKPNREPSAQETNPGLPPLPTLLAHTISTATLEGERISPILASVLFTFKRIEDKLSDFSGRSGHFFRNVWGINNSYHQWSYEENQHSDAIGLILERTDSVSRKDLEDDYYENLARTWEAPFPTGRMMVIYAAFQEQLTSLNYHALVKRAMEEGARTVAEIMKLIAHDEAYHGGGYRAFAKIFAEVDLEGTIKDTLHVAKNFRMPAQHLMRDQKRNSIEIVRVGAFNKQMVSEETIYRVLMGLGFIPQHMARQAADSYWNG